MKKQLPKRPVKNPPPPQTHILHHHEQIYSGPVPPPSVLQGYESIVPGAAERILQMAEKEAEFQREITFQALHAEKIEGRLGQIFGFSIGIAALFVAWKAAELGSIQPRPAS